MIENHLKDRLIEQTKLDIIQEARDKLSFQNSKPISQSPGLPALSRISKLEKLQANYESLQKELKNHKGSPQKSLSKSPEVSQSFPNSINESFSGLKQHLGQMQMLQKRAKEIIDKERLANLGSVSENSSLTEKALKKKRLEKVELKIPVYVPLNSIRKEKNYAPSLVNTVIHNGEIMPVYMVGDPMPRYNPLVRVSKSIPSQNREGYRDSVDATAHSKQNMSIDSVFYYRIYKKEKNKQFFEDKKEETDDDLVEPPAGKVIRPATPVDLPCAWKFRELEKNTERVKPKRGWVKERMEQYYQKRVKKDFLPKISENKSFEVEMKKDRTVPVKSFRRVKIL